MWILPKQLHTSAFVQDTKALGLDSESYSLLCMKSLTWRGKHFVRRTWLQKWKAVTWLQHLCSRTLEPSHTKSFVEKWTSSQEASLVSHSALQELRKGWKTHDTCFPTSPEESDNASPQLSFSKMLKESSVPKQPKASLFSDMSSESWNQWVTTQRQDCLRRVKLERLTREKGFLSWATPNTLDHMAQRSPEALQRQFETSRKGRTQPANLREQVHPENWPTSRTADAEGGRIETEVTPTSFRSKRKTSNQYFGAKLRDAVETLEEQKNWPTATTRMHKGGYQGGRVRNGKVSMDTLDVAVQAYSEGGLLDPTKSNTSGRSHELNPAWVEQLMGIPTGWTDLGFWGTESCPTQL